MNAREIRPAAPHSAASIADAEKLRRALSDSANLTAEVCAWLDSLLSVALQNIGPEPGRQIHARRLLQIALYQVGSLDDSVSCSAEECGIQVGPEVQS